MKSSLKFWLHIISLCALFINISCVPLWAQQQRPRRASNEDEAALILPAGSRILPKGYVLVLRMETRLDSSKNRPSDRFYTRVEETVVDERGAMVLPKNLLVLGHVADVSPAQMRRRSGLIEIAFDKLVMPDGRELPVKGILTSADSEERQKIKLDEEGAIEGGGQTKRNTVFIGGGATAGAVIGAIAGGAALGAGVGAAAGLIAVLLAKGKDAVVEPDTLIGLELTQSLDLTQRGTIPLPPISGTPQNFPNTGNNNGNSLPNNGDPQIPTQPPIVLEPQLLKLSFVQAERVSGGSILVVATAETPTSGWRVKSEQQLNRDTLEIWIKGTPPEGRAAKIASHPTVTVTTPDAKGVLRRVVLHGLGGDRVVNLPPRSTR